jgi:hypothetical protein
MELEERLEKSKVKFEELNKRLQTIKNEEQEVIKEMLRVEGEYRIVEEMIKDTKK